MARRIVSRASSSSLAARRWYDWRVHLVTDDAWMQPEDACLRNIQGALLGGADVVQLRLKHASTAEFLRWAGHLKALCRASSAALIIDDRLDIAIECGADGVHVGRTDTPPDEARRLLGPRKVVGVSTYGERERVAAALHEDVDADYIGSGTTFATATKTSEPVEGLASLGELRGWVREELEAQGRWLGASGELDPSSSSPPPTSPLSSSSLSSSYAFASASYDKAAWDRNPHGIESGSEGRSHGRGPNGGWSFSRPPRHLRGCPVVAIGGVTAANAPDCANNGADGIAAVAGLLSATSHDDAAARATAMLRATAPRGPWPCVADDGDDGN